MRLENILYALAHGVSGYEPMPAGHPNGMQPGMQPGYPYSMPGVLSGLPSGGEHSHALFRPAPAAFGAGANLPPGAWASDGYGVGANAPRMGRPGMLPYRFGARLPPAPYRFQPMPPPSLPAQAPTGQRRVHPRGQDSAQGMRHDHRRTGVEAEPASYESQWSLAFIRDFCPPKNEQEEREQLRLAIDLSRNDHRSRPIKAFAGHLETLAKSTPPMDPVDFKDLPDSMRAPYENEAEYLEALKVESMVPVEKALKQAGMEAVRNVIPENHAQKGFLICLEQLMRDDFDSLHLDAVKLTWGAMERNPEAVETIKNRSPGQPAILDRAQPFRVSNDTGFSLRSTAARLAVDLMNADRADGNKLDVWVISMVDGKPRIRTLGSGSPSARVVGIWDKGDGRFAPIRLKPAEPENYYRY
jgi:hypothetical protein